MIAILVKRIVSNYVRTQFQTTIYKPRLFIEIAHLNRGELVCRNLCKFKLKEKGGRCKQVVNFLTFLIDLVIIGRRGGGR